VSLADDIDRRAILTYPGGGQTEFWYAGGFFGDWETLKGFRGFTFHFQIGAVGVLIFSRYGAGRGLNRKR
jgi:hypothetical protein